MKKRFMIAGLVALVILGVLTGRAYKEHRAYVRELEEFRVVDLRNWIITQRGAAYSLDRAIAEVLVAPVGRLELALTEALKKAHDAQDAMWRSNIPYEFYNAFDRWGYRHAYEQSASYLIYLIEKDTLESLSKVEIEHLTRIRSYTNVIHEGFNGLLPYTLMDMTNRRGERTTRLRSWNSIKDNRDMVSVLETMGQAINLLEKIGAGDVNFSEFLTKKVSAPGRFSSLGLLYSGERKHQEDEMLERAVEFMKTYATGDISNAVFPQESLGSGKASTVVSGKGSGSDMGNYTRFALQDDGTQWRYDIGVTEVGGHINQIELRENSNKVGSQAELLQMAETLVSKWATFEGVALELIQQEHRENEQATYVYALVVEDILKTDLIVGVTVYFESFDAMTFSTIVIDADRYFLRYNAPLPGKAVLTAAEAVALLSPNLTATGEPRLEADGESLEYAIPVTGVDRVYKVYVDAMTGAYTRMEYEYAR